MGKENEKLHEERETDRWKREAAEDRGKDSIENWRLKFREKKKMERKTKVMESKSAGDYKK